MNCPGEELRSVDPEPLQRLARRLPAGDPLAIAILSLPSSMTKREFLSIAVMLAALARARS
jgi:hypothetical protein